MREVFKVLDEGFGFGPREITKYALDFARLTQKQYEQRLKSSRPSLTHTNFPPKPVVSASSLPAEDLSSATTDLAPLFKLRSATPLVAKRSVIPTVATPLKASPPLNVTPTSESPPKKTFDPTLSILFNLLHLMLCLMCVLWSSQYVVDTKLFYQLTEWLFWSDEHILTLPGLESLRTLLQVIGLHNLVLILISMMIFLVCFFIPQMISLFLWDRTFGGGLSLLIHQTIGLFLRLWNKIRVLMRAYKRS